MSLFIHLTGNGNKRDVSSENGEGGGGWSDPWDQGTGGHHRMHQAGADGKSASLAGSLSAALLSGTNGVRDICVFYLLQKQGSFLSFFFSFVIWPHSFLPASLSGPGSFYQLLSVCESQVQAEEENGRTIQDCCFFFSNLKPIFIGEPAQDRDEG